jgi:hypothetical protein
MTKILKYTLFIFPTLTFGQYPFEKFKSPEYKSLEFKMTEKENVLEYTKIATSFFIDKSDLEVSINGNYENSKTNIQVKTERNSKKYFEEIPTQGTDGLYIADFNGDGKKDFKIICFYMGCGLAGLNVRVIYFFQKENKEFTKISFDDKMYGNNRIERDLNGDGKFEIITMTIQYHKNHSYWLFNLYNFNNGNLVCVNNKMNYPIMVQYLFKENYNVTRKLTRKEMKKYELFKPEELLIEN